MQGRPPRAGYRARKFVRRNRTLVAATALVAMALVAGAVGTTWQAVKATGERRRAEARLKDVQGFANSMIFGVHDRILDLPGSTPAREYIATTTVDHLDTIAADSRDAGLLRRVLIEAYERLGTVQKDLGYPKRSLKSHEKSLAQAQAWVAEDPENLDTRSTLADAYFQTGLIKSTLGMIDETRYLQLKAMGIYEDLVAARPESVSYGLALSEVQTRGAFVAVRITIQRQYSVLVGAVATQEMSLGDLEEAEASARKSLELRRAASTKYPDKIYHHEHAI